MTDHFDDEPALLPPPPASAVHTDDARPKERKAAPRPEATPPSDVRAERAVVGAVLVDPDALGMLMPHCKPGDFHDPTLQLAYGAAISLSERGAPLDMLSVYQEMQRIRPGGPADAWLADLIATSDLVGSTLHAEHQAKHVAALARARRVISTAAEIAKYGCQPGVDPVSFVAEAMERLQGTAQEVTTSQVKHISVLLDAVWLRLMDAKARGAEIIGVPTGLAEVDRLLLGLHRTNLVVLAARPAMGKTALALNLAANVARSREVMEAGECVLVFSLEMGAEELTQRMLSSESRTPLVDLRTGRLSIDDEVATRNAAGDLAGLPILIEDSASMSIADLSARARHVAMRMRPRLIVVDYLQLLLGNDRLTREQQVSECARGLKMLAKELDCTVLALAQLNRGVEQRADKRPMMSDLRESGAIEQDADVIGFIYRDCVYNKGAPENVAELIIAKQRSGRPGTANMQYDGRIVRFSSANNF